MNEQIKELLKEISCLCIDSVLNLSINNLGDSFAITVCHNVHGDFKYIGEIAMIVADWKEDSVELLNDLKNKVKNHE
jgi:hypothetical protein